MRNSPLFIESICIQDGKAPLITYHHRRANKTRLDHYDCERLLDLSKEIDLSKGTSERTKCRIIYGKEIISIEYKPYTIRPIKSLQIVDVDTTYAYSYKFQNRKKLDEYYSRRGQADDIIMIKKGFVTDSYYGNLAFLKDGLWFTPMNPMLEGTRRAQLIENGKLIERQIARDEIQEFDSVRIFNAMIEFGEVEIDTSEITGESEIPA